MTKSRHRRERRAALTIELAVLLLATAWTALLLQGASERIPASLQPRATVLLGALVLLLALAYVASLLTPSRLPEQLQKAFRPERDAGLAVGCALVPIVLLSRLVAELYQNHVFSAFTFLYAWTSVSVATSTFIRLIALRSPSLPVAVAVDVAVASALAFVAAPADTAASSSTVALHCVLPALCQCVVSAVFAYGVNAFPRSFTLGEALLVSQGVGMTAFDITLYSVHCLSSTLDVRSIGVALFDSWSIVAIERADYILALQVGVTGALLVCAALAPVLRVYGAASVATIATPLAAPQSLEFAARSLAVVVCVVYPWSCLVLETRNPIAWLAAFVLAHASRVGLIAYWLACLGLLVPLFAFLVDRFAIRTIIARKLFHALVVLMFVPAFAIDAPMLALSYGVALSVFCLFECARAVSLPPVGHHIAAFMKTFIDHRDAGRIVLTHSYLLLGCALPLWLAPTTHTQALAANAGILALGIGDAMGAAVGSTYGARRLIGSKTLEGTLAIFVSIALASMWFHDFHWQLLLHGHSEELVLLLASVFATSVLETCTAQIDNLVLPLFFFATCNLVACHRAASS